MEINTRYIQVRGKVEVGEEYQLGEDLKITVSITDIQDSDNYDGTVDRTYKAKLLDIDWGKDYTWLNET